jgi:hypothetical protein
VNAELAPLPLEIEPWKVLDHSSPIAPLEQWIYKFPNGFGASVVRGTHTYGGQEGLYEITVLKFDGDDFRRTCATPITDSALGWQALEDVAAVLVKVAAL